MKENPQSDFDKYGSSHKWGNENPDLIGQL